MENLCLSWGMLFSLLKRNEMSVIGDIAVYFKTENAETLREPEMRGDFPRVLLNSEFPGLWDFFQVRKITALRCRKQLHAGKGYGGLLLSACYSESYRLLSIALLRQLNRPLPGAFGTAVPLRIISHSTGSSPITTLDMTKKPSPAPLANPVTLRTYSPLYPPFSIAGEINRAQKELSEIMGMKEIAPPKEEPCWMVTSINLSKNGKDETMKGSAEVFSEHPYASLGLKYALLKGFGKHREKGYGTLDISGVGRKS